MGNNYMAVDIDEKEGKLTLGYLADKKLQLEEVHHFSLEQKDTGEALDQTEIIINEIKAGLIRCKEIKKLPVLVGINEWNSELISKLCHMSTLSSLVIKPGSVIGSLSLEVTEEVGYDCIVLISATKLVAAQLEQMKSGDENKEKTEPSASNTLSNLLYLMLFGHEIPNLKAAQELIE